MSTKTFNKQREEAGFRILSSELFNNYEEFVDQKICSIFNDRLDALSPRSRNKIDKQLAGSTDLASLELVL